MTEASAASVSGTASAQVSTSRPAGIGGAGLRASPRKALAATASPAPPSALRRAATCTPTSRYPARKCSPQAGSQAPVRRFHRQWAAVRTLRGPMTVPVQWPPRVELTRPTAPQGQANENGKADEALGRMTAGTHQLLTSQPIIQEVLDVLSRKFSRDREELARVAVFLADLAESVASTQPVDVLLDELDNRILECAVAGNADVIVTGDQAMLRIGQYADVLIMTFWISWRVRAPAGSPAC